MRTFVATVEHDDSGWWIAAVPNIVGAHTSARTREELPARILEATALALDVDASEIHVRLPELFD